MQLEAIYREGQIHFTTPIRLKNHPIRVRIDVPDDEIDGSVFIDGDHGFKPGDKVRCRVVDADEYDMWAEPI